MLPPCTGLETICGVGVPLASQPVRLFSKSPFVSAEPPPPPTAASAATTGAAAARQAEHADARLPVEAARSRARTRSCTRTCSRRSGRRSCSCSHPSGCSRSGCPRRLKSRFSPWVIWPSESPASRPVTRCSGSRLLALDAAVAEGDVAGAGHRDAAHPAERSRRARMCPAGRPTASRSSSPASCGARTSGCRRCWSALTVWSTTTTRGRRSCGRRGGTSAGRRASRAVRCPALTLERPVSYLRLFGCGMHAPPSPQAGVKAATGIAVGPGQLAGPRARTS